MEDYYFRNLYGSKTLRTTDKGIDSLNFGEFKNAWGKL
jgi:hypothetical protein